MALRLIELTIKGDPSTDVEDVLKNRSVLDSWRYRSDNGRQVVMLLVDAENTDEVLASLNERFSESKEFRLVLISVDATLPEVKDDGKGPLQKKTNGFFSKGKHLSIEELYSDISDKSQLSIVYTALAVLSTLVAAFGILRGNTVMIIGAMVIAPLLGPNMAMSLATTLGDFPFFRKSFITSVFYFLSVLIVSVGIGLWFKPGSGTGSIVQYSSANLGAVTLSLAAGAAGALSFTIGLSTMLIGVTVALAVLPSLATTGMMLGAGHPETAYGALLLFLTNIICINLAGVLTFLIQGIHPIKWWEAEKAKKATIGAVVFWAFLLAALVILIRAQNFS